MEILIFFVCKCIILMNGFLNINRIIYESENIKYILKEETMMKAKIILTGIMMTMLAFSMGTTSIDDTVSSELNEIEETVINRVCDYCGGDCQFVDEDGDGVCDNFESGECLGNGSNGQCFGNGVQYNGNNEHCFGNSGGHSGKGHHGGNSGNRGCHR